MFITTACWLPRTFAGVLRHSADDRQAGSPPVLRFR